MQEEFADSPVPKNKPFEHVGLQVDKSKIDEQISGKSVVHFPMFFDGEMHDAKVIVETNCNHLSDENGICYVDLGVTNTAHDVAYDEDAYNLFHVARDVPAASIIAFYEAAKAYEKEHSHDNDRGHEFDEDFAKF